MSWPLRMILLVTTLNVILQLYIFIDLSYTFKILFEKYKNKLKIFILILIVYLNLLPITIIIYYFFNKTQNIFLVSNSLGWLDYLVTYPFWWGLAVTIEITFYFIFIDVLLLISNIALKSYRTRLKRGVSYIRLCIVLLVIIYASGRIYFDTFTIKNSNHKIIVKDLPESLKGLTLTLLGDIQIDRYTQGKKIIDFQNKINKNQSAIIMFAGDLVTRGQHFIPQALDIICKMPKDPHKIAVMGDHDYWANPHKISTGMKDCGWDFLQNQHQIILHNGNRILVTGITNIYSRRINKSTFDRILSTAPESDFKVLLTHQPSPNLVRLAASYGYNLFLGGHTHGGQIAFKPFGFTLTMSMFETPFFSGQYQYQNMPVIVTNGIGLTLAAIRYNVPSEITSITLDSE